jgi:hypothetical protein
MLHALRHDEHLARPNRHRAIAPIDPQLNPQLALNNEERLIRRMLSVLRRYALRMVDHQHLHRHFRRLQLGCRASRRASRPGPVRNPAVARAHHEATGDRAIRA